MDKLRAEIAELKALEVQATHTRVKDMLSMEIRRFETELTTLMESLQENGTFAPKKPKEPSDRVYTVPLTTFAWDQSDKFFKIYLTQDLNGIQNHDISKITHKFTPNSLHVFIEDFNKKNFELAFRQLYDEIIPSDSSLKVKQDMILIMLKKKTAGTTWSGVSKADKSKDKKMPTVDKDKDPNESLMNMMKQMYDEGDDDMKRTIAKAWTESKDKNKGMDA